MSYLIRGHRFRFAAFWKRAMLKPPSNEAGRASRNGDLLTKAEDHGFDVLDTTDQNLRYQPNLDKREIAIVVLRSTSWPRIQRSADLIAEVVSKIGEGDYVEIEIPS